MAGLRYSHLQRGMRSAEGLTQRAIFGAEQAIPQRRPRAFTLHEVVPALASLVLLVLLVVLVATLPSELTLVVLLVLLLTLLLLVLVPLDVGPAAAPAAPRHSSSARWCAIFMMQLERFGAEAGKGAEAPFSFRLLHGARSPRLCRCRAWTSISPSCACCGPWPCPCRACRGRPH